MVWYMISPAVFITCPVLFVRTTFATSPTAVIDIRASNRPPGCLRLIAVVPLKFDIKLAVFAWKTVDQSTILYAGILAIVTGALPSRIHIITEEFGTRVTDNRFTTSPIPVVVLIATVVVVLCRNRPVGLIFRFWARAVLGSDDSDCVVPAMIDDWGEFVMVFPFPHRMLALDEAVTIALLTPDTIAQLGLAVIV
jgi:hypothetical protein